MTRPKAAGERFVASLGAACLKHLTVISAPLIQPEPLAIETDVIHGSDVIFTSAQAVEFVPSPSKTKAQRAYCVGEHTTDRAQASGWLAECRGQDADALVASLIQTPPPSGLLHLRGRFGRGDIANRLTAAGIATRECIVYEQRLQGYDHVKRAEIDAQRSLIVPLFSPRTAEQFVNLAPYSADLHLLAFSNAVAEPLMGMKAADLKICTAPTAPVMRDMVRDAALCLARVEGGAEAQ
ncbi:uroporphyrinogen-III synthase [Phaeobacter sp.]|uniref:uroporphyrinogen-III synthase n=1 Tax=Phaeobacter sp. TaxID=1902409 RepID=UPI0025CFCB97|nr:uroporphyrinogen-III synthase [Phaeobacter sp.]